MLKFSCFWWDGGGGGVIKSKTYSSCLLLRITAAQVSDMTCVYIATEQIAHSTREHQTRDEQTYHNDTNRIIWLLIVFNVFMQIKKIVHMNGINCSSSNTPIAYPQPSTHTHKILHISLPETGRNTTSLCYLYFFIWIRSKEDTAPNFPVWPFMVNIVCTTSIYFLIILYAMFAIFI